MYVAVKGGAAAIEGSWRLLDQQRRGDTKLAALSVAQIRSQLSLAVGRVMTEGSLYDPELAALAIKQAVDTFAAPIKDAAAKLGAALKTWRAEKTAGAAAQAERAAVQRCRDPQHPDDDGVEGLLGERMLRGELDDAPERVGPVPADVDDLEPRVAHRAHHTSIAPADMRRGQ